jgi:hypothetical protein
LGTVTRRYLLVIAPLRRADADRRARRCDRARAFDEARCAARQGTAAPRSGLSRDADGTASISLLFFFLRDTRISTPQRVRNALLRAQHAISQRATVSGR